MTWEVSGLVDQLNDLEQQDHAGVGNIKLTAGRDTTTLASINKTKLLDYEESLRVGLRISAQQNVSSAAKSVDTAKTEGGLANNLRALDSISAAKDGAVSGSAGIVAEYARSESEQQQQSLRGSLFSAANDLSFTSGNNQTHLGTQATAANDLKIKAGGDLVITSAQDLASSQADSFSASVEYGFGSKQAGVSGSLAFSQSKSGNMDHRNAQFIAGNALVLDIKNDATIKGAALKANTIKANIEGNLTLASLQDTSKVRAENANVSGSTSGSFGFGGGYTKGDKTWVTQQTGLIAKNELDLNVKKHTQLDGAIINSESGQLNFSTNTLAYSDLHDSDTFDNQQVSFGFTTPDKAQEDGKLQGKTFDYQAQSHDLKQITRATIGAGNITVNNGTADGINRDASKAQSITRDTEDKVDIYYSDSSYDIVHNTVAGNGDIDLIDVLRPDLFVAEVAGSTIRGIDQVDNAIVDGFTFNSGENFNDKNRGLLADSSMLDLSKKAEAGVKAATAGLMRYTKKDGTKSFIGGATTYEQRFEALYSGKNLNEVLRKNSDLVDDANNLSDKDAQGVQDTLGELSIAAGNKDKNTIVYNNETSSLAKNAKGYSTEKDIGINTDKTDINNVRDVISTVAHENSDHEQHKNGEAGEALTTLMGNETAYQWVNDNRKEGRHTGGYNGTSTADWRKQNNSQQSVLFNKNNARVSKTNPIGMEFRQFNYREAKTLDKARFKINGLDISSKAKMLANALLEATSCSKVRCADNVPSSDPKYKSLKQLQDYGDTLADDSFATLMAQLGVDTTYKVRRFGRSARGRGPHIGQSFGYTTGDSVKDFAQSTTGDWVEAAGERIQGGYEFVVFAGAETINQIFHTKNTAGFAEHMAAQVGKRWTDAEISSIGQTNINSRQASTWQPGQNIIAELALIGVEVVPLLKPVKAVGQVIGTASKKVVGKVTQKVKSRSKHKNNDTSLILSNDYIDSVGAARVRGSVVEKDLPGYIKPEGSFSKVDDPANSYRSAIDGKIRADKNHPQRTGSYIREPGRNPKNNNYIIKDQKPADEINKEMINKGYTPAWREGGMVETGTLKPGQRIETIVDESQLKSIVKEGNLRSLGRWGSENKLPNTIQPSRDATAVKKQWKDDSAGPLYKVELEVKKATDGVPTRRGENAPIMDEDLGRKLQGGVIQHEFIDEARKINNLEIKKITPLKKINNDN